MPDTQLVIRSTIEATVTQASQSFICHFYLAGNNRWRLLCLEEQLDYQLAITSSC